MEEKGTDTNRYQSTTKTKSDLFLLDDAYFKIKKKDKDKCKGLRCKSAINKDKFHFNDNIKNNLISKKSNFHNDLFQTKKNNTYKLRLISAKSRNILNSNTNAINFSNFFKTTDSKVKLNSTKESTKRNRLSSRYNSNLSFFTKNNSARGEYKNNFKLKNNKNFFSVINLNADNFEKKEETFKKQTLKDLTLRNLIKKLNLDKIQKNNKNKHNTEKIRNISYRLYPTFNSDNINRTVNKLDIRKKFLLNKEECKNSGENTQRKYHIKFSFLENTMNKIIHKINFIDIENKEELYQNVLIDFKEKKSKKLEDFKIMGYELSPEKLYQINQNKKQKLIKEKYEKLKHDYILQNLQKIKENNTQRAKTKKNYIPEYKQNFTNVDWKNKKYESIYKYKPNEYYSIIKKNASKSKRKFIKNDLNRKKIKRHNSMLLSPNISNPLENINKQSSNERKSVIYNIDVLKNKQLHQILSNNIQNNKNNYANILNQDKNKIENEIKIKNEIKDENITKISQKEENNIIDIDTNTMIENKIESKNIESKTIMKENSSDGITDINNINFINKSNSMNNTSNIKTINQLEQGKDYNKINQIVKVESIFIGRSDNFDFEILNLSDYIEKIRSIRKFRNRNSFNCPRETRLLSSIKNKNKTKKNAPKIINEKTTKQKSKQRTKRKSVYVPLTTKLNLQNKIFKQNEENKSNIKEVKQDNIEEKMISNIEEINNEDSSYFSNNDIQENDKKLEEYIEFKERRLREQLNQKMIFDKIDTFNYKTRKTYSPFYLSQISKNDSSNKIELNFIGSRKINYYKTISENIGRKHKSKRESQKFTSEFLNKFEEEESSINFEESDESAKDLEARLSLTKKRRDIKSATINFINQKYKELIKKKNSTDINLEISNNINRFQLFKNVNLESVEEIEYHKSILLFKLREDIKYKISQGKCEKSEMDEFNKFENKLNDYKINYNLKNKNKIKEYVLLLLMKFNEYFELFSVRENRKTEETRINKFLTDLNNELDYNIPLSLIIKGRRCSSKNFNGNLSSLSEIKK